MSAGLWARMREQLGQSAEPLTMRELARRLDAMDERPTIRSVLYTMRKRHHVERVAPANVDGHYRWRLLPARATNQGA